MKTINAADFGAYCDELLNVLENAPITDALNKIHEIGIEESTKAFTSKQGPNGEEWAPRKREGDGHPLMVETGSLGTAATGGHGHAFVISDRTLGYGIDMDASQLGAPQTPWKHGLKLVEKSGGTLIYARALNFGFSDRNLPPRPFLGLGEEAKKKAGKAVMDDLSKKIVAIP